MDDVPNVPLAQKSISIAGKIVLILLLGGLSMFFAEVMSGSSILWFAQPWAWLITLPLYMFHALLLLNLAFIFKRSSPLALYLWGVLFGLYEAWITKVVWAGYMGQQPAAGTFLGFAIVEVPVIVLFWHPVMSFIMPILTFQVLSGEKHLLPGHIRMLRKSRITWCIYAFIALIGALFLAMNAKWNVASVVVTIIGSILFIGLFYSIASWKYPAQFSISSLRLGKPGLILTTIYIVALNVLCFFLLLPERIPQLYSILLTLCFYALVITLLYLKKPDEEAGEGMYAEAIFNKRDTCLLLAIFFISSLAFCLVPTISSFVAQCLYILIFALGPVLFIIATIKVLKHRISIPGTRAKP